MNSKRSIAGQEMLVRLHRWRLQGWKARRDLNQPSKCSSYHNSREMVGLLLGEKSESMLLMGRQI